MKGEHSNTQGLGMVLLMETKKVRNGDRVCGGLDLHSRVRQWLNRKVTLGPSSGAGEEGSRQENWSKSVPGRRKSSCKGPEAGGQCGWYGGSLGREQAWEQKGKRVGAVPLKDSEFGFK